MHSSHASCCAHQLLAVGLLSRPLLSCRHVHTSAHSLKRPILINSRGFSLIPGTRRIIKTIMPARVDVSFIEMHRPGYLYRDLDGI